MKLTTLTAILLMSLFAASASLGAGDSTYLEARSARLQQGIADTSQPQAPGIMDTKRIQHREQHRSGAQERWWK
ncbi:hypothetical protein FIU83_12275 [Halomonas sp. THAF5a]|uniref:hypothetical protein n=1 Tax=Halomonas sp. THAF5a TaxID=2587844 RepID=UPI0012690CFA|nr:hypothetical protein [Halomonas sp. THAF5a]QFU02414.1 hypothetical protein FIU83_12275 [Halomonas sp. THAF5a]